MSIHNGGYMVLIARNLRNVHTVYLMYDGTLVGQRHADKLLGPNLVRVKVYVTLPLMANDYAIIAGPS